MFLQYFLDSNAEKKHKFLKNLYWAVFELKISYESQIYKTINNILKILNLFKSERNKIYKGTFKF